MFDSKRITWAIRSTLCWTLSFLIAGMVFLPSSSCAQNSKNPLGYGGLIVVPTAEPADDGTLTVGCGRIPRSYGLQSYPAEKSVYYAAFTATPFFEGSLAWVKPDKLTDRELHAGDRSVSIKMRLIRETKSWPAIAVGAHDFFGIPQLGIRAGNLTPPQNFAALYAVATKSFRSAKGRQVKAHLGYGTDWLPAEQNYLVGVFAGIELFLYRGFSMMAEYDAHDFNFGARINLFSHLQALVFCMDGREFGGGFNFSYQLGNL